MSKTIRVCVTQADIDAGRRDDTDHCPVANAVRRQNQDAGRVRVEGIVGRMRIRFLRSSSIAGEYRIPNKIARRIKDYDNGGGMLPFEFEAESV